MSNMTLTDYFSCPHMDGGRLFYSTCLRRQTKKDGYQNPEYPMCFYCQEGKHIKSLFPEITNGKQYRIKIHSSKHRSKAGKNPYTTHFQREKCSQTACHHVFSSLEHERGLVDSNAESANQRIGVKLKAELSEKRRGAGRGIRPASNLS